MMNGASWRSWKSWRQQIMMTPGGGYNVRCTGHHAVGRDKSIKFARLQGVVSKRISS